MKFLLTVPRVIPIPSLLSLHGCHMVAPQPMAVLGVATHQVVSWSTGDPTWIPHHKIMHTRYAHPLDLLSFIFEGWHEVKSLTLPPLTALYWISITGRVCWAHYLHPYLSCVFFISSLFVNLWALTEFLLAPPHCCCFFLIWVIGFVSLFHLITSFVVF